jgi:hypothetical protein
MNKFIVTKESMEVQKLTCYRCGHEWYPRVKIVMGKAEIKLPSVCPNPACKSKNWGTPKAEDLLRD